MPNSLLNLVDNLAEGLQKGKCIDYKSFLQYVNVKNGLFLFKCIDCNKNYEKEFDKDLAKGLENTYRFCERDIDKFSFMVRKGKEWNKATNKKRILQ